MKQYNLSSEQPNPFNKVFVNWVNRDGPQTQIHIFRFSVKYWSLIILLEGLLHSSKLLAGASVSSNSILPK